MPDKFVWHLRDRQVRFDINCRAADGELIEVEMCFEPEPYEPVRLEFHAAKLFVGQDIRGKDKNYNDLKWAYQIAILATKRIFQDESFIHTFEYYDPAKKMPLNGRTRIITLELSKLGAIIKKAINEMNTQEYWAVFFGCLNDRAQREKINAIIAQEEGIAMASAPEESTALSCVGLLGDRVGAQKTSSMRNKRACFSKRSGR